MLNTILLILFQYPLAFNILFATIVIFFEKRSVASAWAWLMVIFLIPYVGFILYMMLGMESRKHKTFANKSKKNQADLAEILKLDIAGLSFMRPPKSEENVAVFKNTLSIENIDDLLYLNFSAGGGYLSLHNEVDILSSGKEKFDMLIKDIEGAKHFIHVQYYIFRNDGLGKRLVDVLAKKAKQGVEVKLLIDGMGNFFTSKHRLFAPLKKAGGRVGIFLAPHVFRINFQNHRKLAIIDGAIGYIGGFNVGDEYLGKVKRYGFWRDLHIRVLGDAVKEMEIHFIMDWNFVSPKNKIIPNEAYFPKTNKLNQKVLMQVVSAGPDTKWPHIYNGFAKMISEANKSICIQTPYFAPDDNIFESLKIAALSGIDVKIIIPANPDHFFVKWCSMSYLGELLKAGVRCYQYKKGFIHAKFIMIDGLVASVGTTNMDIRSFKLNFEINAFIYDHIICKKLETQFYKDILECEEVTLEAYTNRPWTQKAKEAFSRLLSPLL